jgi:hypothetical protein
MNQLLLSGILLVATTAGAAPLLTLKIQSGKTKLEDALQITCSLSEDGNTISGIRYQGFSSTGNWDQEIQIHQDVTEAEKAQVLSWITEATNGPYQSSRNPCDIGTEIIEAEVAAQKTVLLKSLDCGRRTVNLNPSAQALVTWIRLGCNVARKKP